MARLVKITALLMGLVLLLTTLSTLVARAEKSTERVPLVAENWGNQPTLLQLWPGFRQPFRLTPQRLANPVNWGTDTFGNVRYISFRHGSENTVDFFRLNTSGQLLTLLFEDTEGAIAASPDQRWLVVAVADFADHEYWLVHVPTGQRWSVSDWLESNLQRLPVRGGHRFADDNQWLYMALQANPNHLIGIRLADQTIHDLIALPLHASAIQIEAQLGDWLLLRLGDVLYRVRTDGTDFGALFEGYPSTRDALFGIYEGVALIHRLNQIWAVDVATGEILWQTTEFIMGFPPDGTPGWINIWQEEVNFLLNVQTGQTQPLPAELQGPSTTRRSLEGNHDWVLYSRSGNGQEWWVYDWASAKSRLLRPDMQYFRYVGSAGDWFLAENAAWPYGLYRLHQNNGTFEQVASGRGYALLGMMPPYQPAWQPLPLLLLGVLLIACPMLTPIRKRPLK